jgi:hypothetical protein
MNEQSKFKKAIIENDLKSVIILLKNKNIEPQNGRNWATCHAAQSGNHEI